MRIHLGLVCDPECVITVGDQSRVWREGEIIAFKDGGPYLHSVAHNGTADRWVLVFDLTLDYLRSVANHPAL
jgi:aspartyl/asparaginyl beta-hydroxylase (cupin superfamily)